MEYQLLLFALVGYLIGAIPFGFLLGKIFFKQDVREIGSGGIGATNVLRLGNKWVALATMILDIAKVPFAWFVVEQIIVYMFGWFAAAIVLGIYGLQLKMIVAAAAVIGHCFPVYIKFKGGKGVAAFGGAIMVFSPALFAYLFATWALLLTIGGKSSLAAIVTGILAPFYVLLVKPYSAADNNLLAWFVVALVLFIFTRHAGNIRRLLKGEEPKVELNPKKKEEKKKK